jgi:hypothetical protein
VSIQKGRKRGAMSALLVISAFALILASQAAPVAATDNAKWFVCKYVGTPGDDERLQTGQNPISVSENAIGISPVVPGTFFNDSQGRSYVLVEDTGQDEPDASQCPPPNSGSNPTPTPTPVITPTPTPVVTPTPTPVVTPTPTPEQSVEGSTSTPTPTPEQSVQGGTGTPAPSQPDTAVPFGQGPSPVPTAAFALILLAALGTLAWANVKTARRRA